MSLELEEKAVAKHFRNVGWQPSWGDANLHVAWPNHKFIAPDNHMFCVFSIVDRGTVRRSLGWDFSKRRWASMQIDIYIPAEQGASFSREMSDVLEPIYTLLELPLADGEMVMFDDPTTRVLDPNVIRAANLDDNWDRYVFEAPYHRDYRISK